MAKRNKITEKVQFISFNSLSSGGGISTYIETIRKKLGQKRKVLTFRPKGTTKLSENEICMKAKTFLSEVYWIHPKNIKKMIKALDNAELLHFNPDTLSEIALLILSKIFGKKIVVTFHSNFLKYYGLTAEGNRQAVVNNLCVIFADKVIFVNKAQAKNIERIILFKKKLHLKKIIINNFIDKEKILKSNKSFISKINIIFVGRLTKEKGYDDLMLLAQDKNLRDINFTIVGKRTFDKNILNRENIKYYDVVPNEKIFPIYDRNNILILPSYSESFPLVVLEAMARGLVVLASDIPGMREIIKEGENGYLFSPGDVQKMKELIVALKNNQKEIKRISENNLRDIYNFSAEKQIPKYIQIYEEILNKEKS